MRCPSFPDLCDHHWSGRLTRGLIALRGGQRMWRVGTGSRKPERWHGAGTVLLQDRQAKLGGRTSKCWAMVQFEIFISSQIDSVFSSTFSSAKITSNYYHQNQQVILTSTLRLLHIQTQKLDYISPSSLVKKLTEFSQQPGDSPTQQKRT